MRALAVVLIACCATVAARADDLEDNKRLVRNLMQEVFNNRQPAAADKYLAENYVEHNPRLAQGAGIKQFAVRVLAGFSDYHGEIQDLIAEGDKVVARIVWTGTQDGPFQGLPPSAHKISFATADIFRVDGGKLAEHWDVVDSLPRALALGQVQAVSPPAPAAGK